MPRATRTPRPVPTFTSTPSPTSTPEVSADPQLGPDSIRLFPWPLAAGDRLSVDVDPLHLDPAAVETGGQATVTVALDHGLIYTAEVAPAGLVGQPQARFIWLEGVPVDAAALTLTVTLHLSSQVDDPQPENNRVTLSVPLQVTSTLASPEPLTTWVVTETQGFRLHYLTGSAAERDIDAIVLEARAAYADVTRLLDGAASSVEIYLLDRVVGQGGYASSEWVAVSYADRRYAPTLLGSVLRHELVHRLDTDLGCDGAPSMIREGLAVYVSGGHYRPGGIRAKAAALLATPRYLSPATLVAGFYGHQHEVAYLEAGAIVAYLVDRLGWERLPEFCSGAATDKAVGSGAEALTDAERDRARWEAGLQAVGFTDTAGFEASWQAWLVEGAGAAAASALVEDLDLEFRLMDAMRAYQATYDPAAHFLDGILFSPAEAERLGVVADFVRKPRTVEAIALELVLAMAQEATVEGDAALLALLVDDLESVLEGRAPAAGFVDDAMRITAAVLAQGWEPYHLMPLSSGAYTVLVLDTKAWPRQSALMAQERDSAWMLSGVRLGD